MKPMSQASSVAAAVCLCASVNAAILVTQGFNDVNLPTDWTTQVVTYTSGSVPAVMTVANSVSPGGFLPAEGARFIEFNSFDCQFGSQVRLCQSTPFSCTGVPIVKVQFQWTQDNGYIGTFDAVTVQWSTNWTEWQDADTFVRPAAGASGWHLKSSILPASVGLQSNVFVGFLFTSQYGNNCNLDDVRISGLNAPPSEPPSAFTATAIATNQVALTWMTGAYATAVMIVSNGTPVFGSPIDGVAYATGSSLPGGGGVLYYGPGLGFTNTGLQPGTRYYYQAWSMNVATDYSGATSADAITPPLPVTSFPYHESFESGLGAWSVGGADFEWTRLSGPTPSLGTGPSGAQDGLWYLYTEADSPNNPYQTAITEAVFDFTTVSRPQMTFFYHMCGATMGTLSVEAFTGAWTTVWSLSGPQQADKSDPWTQAHVDMAWLGGMSDVPIRFRGFTGSDYLSDMAVDNVSVLNKAYNVYLWPSVQYATAFAGAAVSYTVQVENATAGNNAFVISGQSAWPVGGIVAATATMAAGETTNLVFTVTVPADAPAGQVCTTTVRAVSTDFVYTNTALLITRCTWTAAWYQEPFDSSMNGWTNYAYGSAPLGWYWYSPYNAMAHDQDPTNADADWLVSPPINLAQGAADRVTLSLSFFGDDVLATPEKILVSAGNPDPSFGDYVPLTSLVVTPGNWKSHQADLTAYLGTDPIYLAIPYLSTNPFQMVSSIAVTADKFGITDAQLMTPTNVAMTSYQTSPVFTGRLCIAHQTGASGPAAHVVAQFGYGLPGTTPGTTWNWLDATYARSDAQYDYYTAQGQISVAGMQEFCFRFRVGEGAWVYADADGSANGYLSEAAGRIAIAVPSVQGELLHALPITSNWAVGPFSMDALASPVPLYYETADDIQFPNDAIIRSIRWGGLYAFTGRRGAEQGFELRIYTDAVTTNPGTLLYQERIPGYADENFFATTFIFKDYTYQHDLATPFVARAGSTYWWSVQMVVTDGTQWAITDTGTQTDGAPAMQTASSNAASWLAWSVDLGVEFYGAFSNVSRISGTVRSANTGLPLEGALVVVSNATTAVTALTLSNGIYSSMVPAGVYVVDASMANYVPGEVPGVSATLNVTTVQDFNLAGSELHLSPSNIHRTLHIGTAATTTVTVVNQGPLDVAFAPVLRDFGAMTGMARRAGARSMDSVRAAVASLVARSGVASAPVRVPGGRTATGATVAEWYLSRPDQIASTLTADKLGKKMSWNYQVAVCGADFDNCLADVQTNLLNSGYFSSVTAINVSGVTPTLLELRAFDAVMVFSQFMYADSTALGDVMADYLDTGGNVVCTMFEIAWGTPSDTIGTMMGRWNAGSYRAIPRTSQYQASHAFLGGIYEPSHPIMQGVTSFDGGFDGANGSYRPGTNGIAAGAQRIADWTDGRPLVVTLETNGSRIVNLGFYPVSAALGYLSYWNPATDGARLLANAMLWASRGNPWVRCTSNSASVASNGTNHFDVIFNAGAVPNLGTYTAELTAIGSFVNPAPVVALRMDVVNGPQLNLDPTVVEFPVTPLFTTNAQSVLCANIGDGVLTCTVGTVDTPFAYQGGTNVILMASASTGLVFQFIPDTIGAITNHVLFSGNGGDRTLTLTGIGVPEPVAGLVIMASALWAMRRARPGRVRTRLD